MSKILHIPSGQILTFLVGHVNNLRTTDYEKSIYATEDGIVNHTDKHPPIENAEQFIASLCNRFNINRHARFKAKFKIDNDCSCEEFEILK